VIQRRSHLLGIFNYQCPESRGRRVAKAIQNAAEIAEKTRQRKGAK
jgi:hypothetical protein